MDRRQEAYVRNVPGGLQQLAPEAVQQSLLRLRQRKENGKFENISIWETSEIKNPYCIDVILVFKY